MDERCNLWYRVPAPTFCYGFIVHSVKQPPSPSCLSGTCVTGNEKAPAQLTVAGAFGITSLRVIGYRVRGASHMKQPQTHKELTP